MNDLLKVWEQHSGRGAFKVTSYIEPQDRHLSRFRDTEVSLLEIGVFFGGSLQIWRDYLGPCAQITGGSASLCSARRSLWTTVPREWNPANQKSDLRKKIGLGGCNLNLSSS